TVLAASATASPRLPVERPSGPDVAQTRRSGATTSAPIASPSHQTDHSGANALHGCSPLAHRLVTPIVAAAIELTAPPKTTRTTVTSPGRIARFTGRMYRSVTGGATPRLPLQ